MSRRRTEEDADEDHYSESGNSILQAEADKIKADSVMAVRKVILQEQTMARVEEANEIWKGLRKS